MKPRLTSPKTDDDKSKKELVDELKKLRNSHNMLKDTIARYERIATYYKSPDAAWEDLEVQKQLLLSLKEEMKANEEELSIENDELSAQVEESIDRNNELREAEAGLKDARAKAELYVDLMGHDITNMNQIAMGYLELARMKIENEGSLGQDDLTLIVKPYNALEDSSRLITNVRKIQNEMAGFYKYEAIALNKILNEVIGDYSNIPDRNVTINYVNGGRNHCTVMANELLKEVFLNLVGNAIEHSINDVIIDIKISRATDNGKNYCKVTVEDNGPGISDDLKCKLFDRLILSGEQSQGRGFGLCLIKMLVDSYQGKFWVEDRVPGDFSKGAKFVVLLPAIEK